MPAVMDRPKHYTHLPTPPRHSELENSKPVWGLFTPKVWVLQVGIDRYVAMPVPGFDCDAIVCFESEVGALDWVQHRNHPAEFTKLAPKPKCVDFEEARGIAKSKPDPIKALVLLDPTEEFRPLDVHYVK